MKKYRSRAVVPLLLLAVYALLLLTRLIPTARIDTTAKLFFALVILEILVYALPTFLFSKLRGQDYLKTLDLNPFPFKKIPFLLALTLLALSAGLVINALFYFLGIGSASYTSLGSVILSDISTDYAPLYVILAYGAIPAFCEELLFRGVILTEYHKYSFLTAAIFSSTAYALCYFDLAGFPFYFLSGMLLAFAVRMTGSVFAAVFMRFAINIASIYLMPTVWSLVTQPLGVLFALFVAITLFTVCLYFALTATETCYRHMASDASFAADTPFPWKKSLYNTVKAFTSPTFLLCLLTYTVTVIVRLVTR